MERSLPSPDEKLSYNLRTVPASTDTTHRPDYSIGPRSFALGDPFRFAVPARIDMACWALIVAIIALPLRGLYAATGSSMEEAFMLVFPERLVAGDVPNVDFLHLYGPGSLDALAGWYGLFGHSLASQRTFGLLQHLAVIAAVYTLTKLWGRIAATTCAIVCALLVLTPIGLSALAWEGGLALGLWSIVFTVRAMNLRAHDKAFSGWLIAAGLLAGLSLSFRPDLIVAVSLAQLFLLARESRRHLAQSWKPFGAGLLLGLVPVFVHLGRAGIGPSFRGMVVDPVVHLRPGRELPRPPSWGIADGALQAVAEGRPPWWRLPALSVSQQLFVWFFAMIAVAVANIVVARRSLRDARVAESAPNAARGVALMAGSLFALGIVQQGLQRPDSTHLAWVTCISFSLLPVAIVEVLQRRLPTWRPTRQRLLSIAVIASMFLVVCPFFTYRAYILHSRVSVGDLPVPFQIQRDDRQFWVGDYFVGEASNEVVDDLDRLARPGERLLVGPADLARTIYSDVMFYYFFPELTPATYYIEMDPGLADKEGSRLADDVRSADWLILTNFWTGWNEPNASSVRGSDAANQVVANEFCLVENYPRVPDPRFPSTDSLILLYRRCATGDGISPAEVGEISALERAAGQ